MIRGVSLSILGFSAVFAVAFATKGCYLCNSYTDNDQTACVDPMSPYPYVNYTFCPDSYVCTRVSYITQKQYVVSRGCDPAGNTCDSIYNTLHTYYPDISTYNCYWCNGDYCNSASGITHSGELIASDFIKPNKGSVVHKEAEEIVPDVNKV